MTLATRNWVAFLRAMIHEMRIRREIQPEIPLRIFAKHTPLLIF